MGLFHQFAGMFTVVRFLLSAAVMIDGTCCCCFQMAVNTLQDGAPLRHRRHPTRRQNAQTEDEDGSSQPHVGHLRHYLPFFYNQRFI